MKTNDTLQAKNNALAGLVAKAKTGDQAAFTELYDRTAPELYRCIRAMTRDEDLAWDIQQDSYLRAYESLDTLENDAAFFPWLRRIAVNITARKMSQRRSLTFTELAGDDDDDAFPELPDLSPESQPELALDQKETSRLVQEILSKLPEEQQLIVGMRYYDELSVKEIAATLNLSTGTVKAQLFHGREKVETAVRALEKQGVKLYGLSPLPFLIALLRRMEPAEAARQAAVKTVVAKAGLTAGAKTAALAAGSTGAASAATEAVVLHATRPFFTTVLGKIVLGVLCAGVVTGGVVGFRWAKNTLFKTSNPNPYIVETGEDPQNSTDAPAIPVEISTTGEAEIEISTPQDTEPTFTENDHAPTETDSSAPETAPAEESEADRDAISIANISAACAEALTASQTKSDTQNAVYIHLPGREAEGISVVAVKDVSIRSEEADDWSNLASDLPHPVPDDPGEPGAYPMIFSLYNGEINEAYFVPQSYFQELLLDDRSFVNMRAAYEEAKTACLAEADTQHATYMKIPGHEDYAVVAVKGVSILSEHADDWSGLPSYTFQMPEDPGKPGTYMMVFSVQEGVLNGSSLEESDDLAAFAEGLPARWEATNDASSLANMRSAYAEATTAYILEENSDNCVYAKSIDEEGVLTVTVTVRNVRILSETADNWNGLGAGQPFPLPDDPGVPGFYTVIFTYSSTSEEYGGLTDVSFGEFRAFLDYTEINKQNSDPQERSLEEEDFRNLRAAYAEMKIYYETEGHAGTSREYEVRQRVKGWHQELYDFNYGFSESSLGSDALLRDAIYALSERTSGKFTLTVSADENGEVKFNVNLID